MTFGVKQTQSVCHYEVKMRYFTLNLTRCCRSAYLNVESG